jgi:hypothetical protein
LKNVGLKCFFLTVEKTSLYSFEKAAAEIGFSLVRHLGTLHAEEESRLDQEEKKIFRLLLDEYMRSLEPYEASRLKSVISPLGSQEKCPDKIIKCKSLARVIGKEDSLTVNIEVPFPYFDPQRKHFYVDCSSTPEIILAHLY